MERLKINIDLSDETLNNRKKMFNEIKDDKRIIKFLNDYKLDNNFLAENIQRFYDWINQLNLSEMCKSSNICLLENKGYYFDLVYDDGLLIKQLKPCAHQLEYDKKMFFLDNYIIKDFPDSLLTITIREIMSKEEPDSYKVNVIKLASFIEDPRGAGYYIYGDLGVGKTYLLSAITNELAKKGFKIAFVNLPSLANNLRSLISENHSLERTLYNLRNVDILVLDDIGSENVTNWFRDEILLSVLNYRMEALKSTFFTSNLSIDELLEHYSVNNRNEFNELAASRVIERIKSLSIPLKFTGKNRRTQIKKDVSE